MNLSVYTLEQSEAWDCLVKSFKSYDVYWLSGYVKAFKLHGDGEPMLFYYEADNLRGINVVMKRDIALSEHFVGKLPEATYFDFSSPYGYGGWIIEGEGDERALWQAYEQWCRSNSIISEFVRFHPVLENEARAQGGYETVFLGPTIAMDLSSPEAIWANITSKNRNMIRKAQKNGIRIYNGNFPEIYKKFPEIYNLTMQKDNANKYYYFKDEFYQSILNDLPQNAQIFYAMLEDEIIAVSIVLAADGKMNYHLSGSLLEYQGLAPTNLLLYHAALWGSANGCKTFHLGGGVGAREDGLYSFKKAFYRGEPKGYHIGKKIFDAEAYDKLVSLRNDLEESGFFPRYRA